MRNRVATLGLGIGLTAAALAGCGEMQSSSEADTEKNKANETTLATDCLDNDREYGSHDFAQSAGLVLKSCVHLGQTELFNEDSYEANLYVAEFKNPKTGQLLSCILTSNYAGDAGINTDCDWVGYHQPTQPK